MSTKHVMVGRIEGGEMSIRTARTLRAGRIVDAPVLFALREGEDLTNTDGQATRKVGVDTDHQQHSRSN